MTDHPILDLEQLDDLRSAVGAAAMTGLLGKFRDGVTDARTGIDQARHDGAPAEIRRVAHRTAGLCLQLAAPRAGAIAARLQASPDDDAAANHLCAALDELQAALAVQLQRPNG